MPRGVKKPTGTRIGQRPLTCSVRTGPPECRVEAGEAGFPRVNEWGDGRKAQVTRLLFQKVKQQERWREEVNLRDVFIKMGMISTGLMAEQKGPGEPERREKTWEEEDCRRPAQEDGKVFHQRHQPGLPWWLRVKTALPVHRGTSSVTGWGTKILHAVQSGQKKEKNRKETVSTNRSTLAP